MKKYIAKVGINFDGLKPPVRVEAGQSIPSNVPEQTIQELLHDGAIEEVVEKAEAKK